MAKRKKKKPAPEARRGGAVCSVCTKKFTSFEERRVVAGVDTSVVFGICPEGHSEMLPDR